MTEVEESTSSILNMPEKNDPNIDRGDLVKTEDNKNQRNPATLNQSITLKSVNQPRSKYDVNLLNSPAIAQEQFHILVVDDEPVNLQVLVNTLSLENYFVTTASNGLEVLEMIGGGLQPDLIVLDVMMPFMTGYEVCKKNP